MLERVCVGGVVCWKWKRGRWMDSKDVVEVKGGNSLYHRLDRINKHFQLKPEYYFVIRTRFEGEGKAIHRRGGKRQVFAVAPDLLNQKTKTFSRTTPLQATQLPH
jgi:hypothetical protein